MLRTILVCFAILIGMQAAPAVACRTYNRLADISVIQEQLPAKPPLDAFVAKIQFEHIGGGWPDLFRGARARITRLVQGTYLGTDVIVRDHAGPGEFRPICYDPMRTGAGYIIGRPVGYENGVLVIQPALVQPADTSLERLLTDLSAKKITLVLPTLPHPPAPRRSAAASPRSRRAR